MQGELEWQVLDIEPDEWDRRMATLDVAAAANGFPVAAGPVRNDGTATTVRDDYPRKSWQPRRWPWRRLAGGGAALLLLAAAIGYNVWHTAQQGLSLVQADVANVVKLETIRQRANLPERQITDSVESIKLAGDAAMAEVVITQTLPSGAVKVTQQLRFYAQTSTGWQRTVPAATFWGPASSLDTIHLHFTFGTLDRASVEQIAPLAEALYAGLLRATGQERSASTLLTIELVPQYLEKGVVGNGSGIQVTSPALFVPLAMPKEQTLARLLLDGMCEPMRAAALRQTHFKPQWQPLADSLSCLLLAQAILAPLPAPVTAPAASSGDVEGHTELDAMLDWAWAADTATGARATSTTPTDDQTNLSAYEPSPSQMRGLAASHLLYYIGATQGAGTLHRLLLGFGQYDDWDSLSPAVLGISAAELERAWRAEPAISEESASLFGPVSRLWTR